MGAQKNAWQRRAVNPGNLVAVPVLAHHWPFLNDCGQVLGEELCLRLREKLRLPSSWQREQMQFFFLMTFSWTQGYETEQPQTSTQRGSAAALKVPEAGTHLSRFLGCQVLVDSYIFISQHDPNILTLCKPAISRGISLFRDNIIARGGTLNQQPHHSGLNLARLWFSFKQMTEKKVIVYLKQDIALLPKKEMNS